MTAETKVGMPEEFMPGTTIFQQHNETAQMAPHSLVNESTFNEFDSAGSMSETSASVRDFVSAADIVTDTQHVTADSYHKNLTLHNNVTSFPSLETDSVSTLPPVIQKQSSSKIIEALTSESGYIETTMLDLESTTQNSGDDVLVEQSSTVGIAVGVTIAVLVVLVVVIIFIFFFIRRRRLRQKQETNVVMENPQYTLERNSTIPKNFDLTMHTGPMLRNQAKNSSADNLTKTNGKGKKTAPPRPPIYKPIVSKDSASKRKAPQPPKHDGYEDLYEKDSVAGSIEGIELTPLYTVDNESADPVAIDAKPSPSKPLLETFHPQRKSPKRNSKLGSGDKAKETETKKDEAKTEDEEMKTALLSKDKKAASNLSLDSYDKTKNPFLSG